jgi:hypothetical protein
MTIAGKEFMADHKQDQQDELSASITRAHEDLAAIMAALNKGGPGRHACRCPAAITGYSNYRAAQLTGLL